MGPGLVLRIRQTQHQSVAHLDENFDYSIRSSFRPYTTVHRGAAGQDPDGEQLGYVFGDHLLDLIMRQPAAVWAGASAEQAQRVLELWLRHPDGGLLLVLAVAQWFAWREALDSYIESGAARLQGWDVPLVVRPHSPLFASGQGASTLRWSSSKCGS